MEKVNGVSGRGVFVPGHDIDTDRIIPARFMKCVTFEGLGEFLFYDVRHDGDDEDIPHPLNDPRYSGASILLTGSNFGCGSSREHAPQAIYRGGFRAVVAESFAEIFFGNCTTLGIPCAAATREDIAEMAAAVEADPGLEIAVDVVRLEIRCGGKSYPFEMPESARNALTNGHWDPIASLLEGDSEVAATAAALDYMAR